MGFAALRQHILSINGLNCGQTTPRREREVGREKERSVLLVWQQHKYLFPLLLHGVDGQLTWRMRAAAAAVAAVAYRTRNAGACVRLTAATNDKTKANQSRTCRSCCCCCCCSPCWRCLCVLIPFDKIMPGITFKWGFGPHSPTPLRTQLSLIYSRPAACCLQCCFLNRLL